MADGCRDCRTCTKSLLGRTARGVLYAVTLSWLVKPVFLRNCPQCGHVMRRHERRGDGSFQD
ncbi:MULTISPECIES: hypothetical protein [Streptomyces]|uniref:Uncharacterized protein n=1 Tax=Streptomyces cremeus TaxID=66881 RepID=A0ABV5P7E5_STRCM